MTPLNRSLTSARSISPYTPRHPIIAASVAAGIAVVGLISFEVGYIRTSGWLADQQAAALQAEIANTALREELGRMRSQLGALQDRLGAQTDETRTRQQQRSEVESRPIAAVVAPLNADRLARLTKALDQAEHELHLTASQRAALLVRLSKIDADLYQEPARTSPTHVSLGQSQQDIQRFQAEHDKAAAERDAVRPQLNQLQQQQPQKPSMAAPLPAVPPAILSPVGNIERVLTSAGVDVARLFSQFGVSRGMGGPFVPATSGAAAPSPLPPEKLAALGAMMRTLPISAPLTSYELGSPFGVRRDPINGRSSLHTGLDLDAPLMSPVYATAPGVVTYAGYSDDYGKTVEIDHGEGISTRYAHLHRYTVGVGQHVAEHTQIGLLGSTGRVTGPHLHYEVLVNGKPQDPANFLQLSGFVLVAQQR